MGTLTLSLTGACLELNFFATYPVELPVATLKNRDALSATSASNKNTAPVSRRIGLALNSAGSACRVGVE